MLNVEDEYFRIWGEAGGAARLQRAFSLYAEMRAILEFQLRKKHPELSEEELPLLVASVMYLSDNAAQRLIQQARKELC
jgi:hypothetical protein